MSTKKFEYKILRSDWDGSYFGRARIRCRNGLLLDIGTNINRNKKWKRKELRDAIEKTIEQYIK